MLEIEQQKFSRNWNGHNFSLRCAIQVHHISRRSKLNNRSSREIQMVRTFHTEVKFRPITYRDSQNWTTEALKKFKMLITFHSNVWFRCITYRDARNWTTEALQKFKWSKLFTRRSDSGAWYIEMFVIEQRKPSRNSNGHNFSLGCPIQAHHISRRSELNNESYEEIQMVITFHSNVRFRCITYRDARNWITEAMNKFKWS